MTGQGVEWLAQDSRNDGVDVLGVKWSSLQCHHLRVSYMLSCENLRGRSKIVDT